jgi:hypothetical protein
MVETLMKDTKSFVRYLLAPMLAVAMVNSLSAQTQGYANVAKITGSVRYSTGNNVWVPLEKVGTKLRPGTVIQTAANSSVDLVLGVGEPSTTPASYNPYAGASPSGGQSYQPSASQNMVRVFQNSILGIDKLASTETGAGPETETQLDLRKGNIMGNVKKLSEGSKYEVKLPNGVAGVKGATYYLSADGVVRVLEGSVVIAYVGADGTVATQVVGAGQQFTGATGQVSQMSDADLNAMSKMAKELKVTSKQAATTFVLDQTIYFVSPSAGHNGVPAATAPVAGGGGGN